MIPANAVAVKGQPRDSHEMVIEVRQGATSERADIRDTAPQPTTATAASKVLRVSGSLTNMGTQAVPILLTAAKVTKPGWKR